MSKESDGDGSAKDQKSVPNHRYTRLSGPLRMNIFSDGSVIEVGDKGSALCFTYDSGRIGVGNDWVTLPSRVTSCVEIGPDGQILIDGMSFALRLAIEVAASARGTGPSTAVPPKQTTPVTTYDSKKRKRDLEYEEGMPTQDEEEALRDAEYTPPKEPEPVPAVPSSSSSGNGNGSGSGVEASEDAFFDSTIPFDPYQFLGVKRAASKSEITRAFHRMSKVLHPDRPGGSNSTFTKLKAARDLAERGVFVPMSRRPASSAAAGGVKSQFSSQPAVAHPPVLSDEAKRAMERQAKRLTDRMDRQNRAVAQQTSARYVPGNIVKPMPPRASRQWNCHRETYTRPPPPPPGKIKSAAAATAAAAPASTTAKAFFWPRKNTASASTASSASK